MVVALLLVYGVADAGTTAPRRGVAGGAAPSYSQTETYDTNPGYDLTWTTGVGTPEPDYTPAIGSGESLRMPGLEDAATTSTCVSFTAADEQQFYFLLRPVSQNMNTNGAKISVITYNNTTIQGYMSIVSSAGTGTAVKIKGTHGTANATTVGTMSLGSTYLVGYRVTKSTASNGELEIAFSSDTTVSNLPASGDNYIYINTGTGANQINKFCFYNEYGSGFGVDYITDDWRRL